MSTSFYFFDALFCVTLRISNNYITKNTQLMQPLIPTFFLLLHFYSLLLNKGATLSIYGGMLCLVKDVLLTIKAAKNY